MEALPLVSAPSQSQAGKDLWRLCLLAWTTYLTHVSIRNHLRQSLRLFIPRETLGTRENEGKSLEAEPQTVHSQGDPGNEGIT